MAFVSWLLPRPSSRQRRNRLGGQEFTGTYISCYFAQLPPCTPQVPCTRSRPCRAFRSTQGTTRPLGNPSANTRAETATRWTDHRSRVSYGLPSLGTPRYSSRTRSAQLGRPCRASLAPNHACIAVSTPHNGGYWVDIQGCTCFFRSSPSLVPLSSRKRGVTR